VVFNLVSIVAALTLGGTPAQQSGDQDQVLDTPKTHWMFEALVETRKMGLLVGYPDGLGYRRKPGMSKYQFIVAFHAVCANLHDLRRGFDRMSWTSGDRNSKAQLNETVRILRDWQLPEYRCVPKALKRIADEFSPEIKTLGAKPETYYEAVGDFETLSGGLNLMQFADVPKDHWAAKAVLELRQAGIMDGYPSGRFNQ